MRGKEHKGNIRWEISDGKYKREKQMKL